MHVGYNTFCTVYFAKLTTLEPSSSYLYNWPFRKELVRATQLNFKSVVTFEFIIAIYSNKYSDLILKPGKSIKSTLGMLLSAIQTQNPCSVNGIYYLFSHYNYF